MSQNKAASWAYAEQVASEESFAAAARIASNELGITCPSVATGQFLASVAAQSHIKNIAEVGTGTGLSSLRMMLANSETSLTSLDIDAEAQGYARELFNRAGIRTARYRLINGRSADLLPRLAPNSYDLVLIDGDPLEASGDAQEAIRLLRTGGVLIVLHALYGDRVADPARRDEITVAWRNVGTELLNSEELVTSLLPIGDGVLFAVKK